MNLRIMLDGGDIQRYHTKRTLRRQTVAEHSWRMIAILRYVWPQASANLLMAVALHDVSEIVTGDIPSPVKWANPVLRKELNSITTKFELDMGLRPGLTIQEQELLSWLDYCEGTMFCVEELTMGNLNMLGTTNRYLEKLAEIPRHTDNQSKVLENLTEQHHKFTGE